MLSTDDYPVVRASEVAPRLVGPLRACDGEMGVVLNDHGAGAGLVRRLHTSRGWTASWKEGPSRGGALDGFCRPKVTALVLRAGGG